MENLTRWDSYFDNKKKFKRGRDLYRLRRSLLSLSILTVLSSYSGVVQASLKHDNEEIKEELSLLIQEDAQSLESFLQDEKEYLLLQKKIEREIDLRNWRVGRLFLLEHGQSLIKPHLILGDELEDDTSPIVIGKDVTVEAEETIVFGSHSEADQIGAVAIGFDTKADGVAAIAQGHHAEAQGDEAVAIGQHSRTLKDEAIAIGGETVAKGESSISIGHGAMSNNDYAIAFGSSAIADGNVSVAIGADSQALGGGSLSIGSKSYSGKYGATAIGREAKAVDMFSTAIGFKAQATGHGSMALGNEAQSLGEDSVAIGNNSIVNNNNEVSFGNDRLKRKLVNVAKGKIEKDSTDAINGSQLHATNEQITTITNQTGKRITGIEEAFGAGAKFDDEGVLKQPNYSTALALPEDQKIVDGVEAGFQYVGKTLNDHDTRIEANATNIKNITQGTAGIVKLDNDKIVIDHQLAQGAMVFDLSDQDQEGELVARQLTGVAIGEVSDTSSDAINGSQLHATNTEVSQIDQRVTKHESSINNLEGRVSQNEGDIGDIGDQITMITNQTGKRIAGIEEAFGAGAKFDDEGVLKQPNYSTVLALPEDQKIVDGVEAGFQYVGKTLIDHDTRIEANATNIKNITQGTAGIVKLDNDKIVIDHQLAQGAMVFDLSDQDQEGELVARQLTGVAIGEVSDTSSDAINGSQLHATNTQVSQIDQRVTKHESSINNLEGRVSQNEGDIGDIGDQITMITNQTGKRIAGIEEAFGAGAKFDDEGVLKQPNYSTALALPEDQKIVDGVEAGFQYVGKTLNDHDTRIEANATNIKNIQRGTAGIVKLDNDKIVIDHQLAQGAMIFDFSNSGKNRVLTGISRGKISQNSTDAVNGSQLFETDRKINEITNLNNQSLAGIADAFGGDTYVKDGVLKGVDFTNSLKTDKPITNINDGFGYVADRLDDHGKRLDKHDTKLENHENRITHLEGNISNITEGKSGLVQLSEDQKTLVVDNDLGKNADTFDISNSNDERILTGVKSGQVAENSKDALNGGQLYASNQSIAEMFGGGATIDKEGYISTPEYRFGDDHVFNNVGDSFSYLNSKIQDHGIFSLDREKNQIILAENGDINQETVINMGNHKVVGVANGQVEKGSLDAVNGGQLWETNQKVVSNSNQIKHINSTLSHYNSRISNLERRVQQNRKVASAGVSSAIAMSSIPYSQSNKHSFGMGVGSYDGEAAVSMGVIFNISPDARFKIQGSYDTQNKAGVGVGFSIDF